MTKGSCAPERQELPLQFDSLQKDLISYAYCRESSSNDRRTDALAIKSPVSFNDRTSCTYLPRYLTSSEC